MNRVTENLASLYERERKNRQEIEKRSAHAFIRSEIPDPRKIQKIIGIEQGEHEVKGYIRCNPHDFIVEEVVSEHDIATIDPLEHNVQEETTREELPTIYCDLVKYGVGTPEAISQIASALNISANGIGHAGLKDSRALTSQRISIRGASVPALAQLPKAQFFIKIRAIGKGAIAPGNLSGNRFVITVRTNKPVPTESLSHRLKELEDDGFPNFYGAQRFGNRFLCARLGKLICQGKFEEAVRVFLTDSGPVSVLIHEKIRESADRAFGNWNQMTKVFDVLPYAYRHERTLIKTLDDSGSNWTGGLYAIQDQVKFWVYGYASYLVNQMLSHALTGTRAIPDPLPIPLGSVWADEVYRQFLEEDDTIEYKQHLQPLKFIQLKPRSLRPWISPIIHSHAVVPSGFIVFFTLPRAAYATTFLQSLCELYEGTPMPDWVNTEQVDSMKILGRGSVQKTLSCLEIPEHLLPDKK